MTNETPYPLTAFMEATTPGGRESKLLPYLEEINLARSRKYTLKQIQAWLQRNGVDISIKGISKFIKTQERRNAPRAHDHHDAPSRIVNGADLDRARAVKGDGFKKDSHARIAAEFIRDDRNSVLNAMKGNQ
jgi:hypothetical protein